MKRTVLIIFLIVITISIYSEEKKKDYFDLSLQILSIGSGAFAYACGNALQERLDGNVDTIRQYNDMNLSLDDHKLIHIGTETLSLSLNMVHAYNFYNYYLKSNKKVMTDHIRCGVISGSILTAMSGGFFAYIDNNEAMAVMGSVTLILQLIDLSFVIFL